MLVHTFNDLSVVEFNFIIGIEKFRNRKEKKTQINRKPTQPKNPSRPSTLSSGPVFLAAARPSRPNPARGPIWPAPARSCATPALTSAQRARSRQRGPTPHAPQPGLPRVAAQPTRPAPQRTSPLPHSLRPRARLSAPSHSPFLSSSPCRDTLLRSVRSARPPAPRLACPWALPPLQVHQ